MMAGSEYYEDRFCEHNQNIGHYGSGCILCDANNKARSVRMRKATNLSYRLETLLKSVPECEWDNLVVGIKTDKGWIR